MSLLDTASLVVTPNGTKASKLYSVVPSSGAGDLSVTRATTATRVNSAGLIESVASNVPRLDYSNGSCPSILVEPQRTNIALWSEQIDNNSAWFYDNGGTGTVNVTPNYATAPNGLNTADRLQYLKGDGYGRAQQLFTGVVGQTYTLSIYVKSLSGTPTIALLYDGASVLTINTTTNWVRHTITFVASSTDIRIFTGLFTSVPSTSSTADVLLWGAQLEAGSYATSYIPTTSASVTRNADVISKTSISSLIGQTQGTVFLDFVATGGDVNHEILGITLNGGGSEFIALYSLTNGALYFVTNLIGGVLIDASSFGERFKVAYSFNSGSHVLYVNGVQIYSSTIASTYSLLNALYLGVNAGGTGQQLLNTNLSALWKTRLTNTQLAQLTTI